MFRAHWWAAVAAVTRQVGDLEVAEDAVQDGCAAALAQWPAEGVPASPRRWLIGTARHKALDRLRRERRRADKQAAVLRVVYLVFTEGHLAAGGDALIRGDLCDQAIRLARALTAPERAYLARRMQDW